MKQQKFIEILNNGFSYFLLADLGTLNNFKQQKNLSNNLANEFTTTMNGYDVIKDGAMIPLSGIEPGPHVIIFSFEKNNIELLKEDSVLQFERDGYVLKIESGELHLFTWRTLENYTEETIEKTKAMSKKLHYPTAHIENGWYKIKIFGGLTMQIDTSDNVSYPEPTLEFYIEKTEHQEELTADCLQPFTITDTGY